MFVKNRGFSLIEVLITLSIFVVILSFALFFNFSIFSESNLLQERDRVLSFLFLVRSRAMTNSEANHGLIINESGVFIFEGQSFEESENKQLMIKDTSFSLEESFEFIFEKQSGHFLGGGKKLILSNENNKAEISVNSLGMIDW